jgi:hypothetical protein
MSSAREDRRRWNGRIASIAVLAVAAAGAALFAAGCGGGSSGARVAQVGTTTTSTSGSSSSGGSGKGNPAGYSACMRKNGVPNFPDPDSNGRIWINGPKLGMNVDSVQFKAATKACRKPAPKGNELSPAEQAEDREEFLKFSACMRSHGLAKFRDPAPSGGLTLGKNSGIDLNSPQFKEAQKACADLLPGRGPNGSTSGSSGTP